MASITPFTTLIAFQNGQETVGVPSSLEPREPDPDAKDQKPGGLFDSPLMPLMMILFLAFLIFGGGDKKRRKKRDEMIGALKKGEEVMTTGGLFGHISKIDEDVITLVVADGVRMRFSTSAIQGPTVEPEPDDKSKSKDNDKSNDKSKDKSKDNGKDNGKDKDNGGQPADKAAEKAEA